MAGIEDVLKDLEGAIAPEALKTLAEKLKGVVSEKEQEFTKAAEEKYGIKPALISDVEKTVEDAAPAAAKAVEDALPADLKGFISDLLSQVQALTTQVAALKASGGVENQTTAVMGQGEPVPHTLFLEDGSIVQNHPGVATHYSVTNPATATEDETETVKQVVACYPTA